MAFYPCGQTSPTTLALPTISTISNSSIASFDTDRTEDLVDCIVNVNAIQDLHGYSYPWVGDAGKNKFPLTVANLKSANTTGTWSGNVYTHQGLTYTIQTDSANNVIGILVTGTASGNTSFYIIATSTPVSFDTDMILSGCPSGGTYSTYGFRGQDGSFAEYGSGVTIPANNGVYGRIFVSSGYTIPTGGLVYKPMIRLATVSDATFEPYENICPITGHTESNVVRCGKNLFNPTTTITNSYIRAGNTSPEQPLGSVISNNSFNCSDYIKVNPNTVYSITLPVYQSATGAGLVYFQDKSVSSAISGVTCSAQGSEIYTFTTPNNCHYIRFSWKNSDGNNCQLENGQPTSYIVYNGTTFLVAFGQTVYGGYIDCVTGKCVITHGIYTLTGSELYSHWGNAYYTTVISPYGINDATTINCISSMCESKSTTQLYSLSSGYACGLRSNSLYISTDVYNDISSFVGMQIVYPFATPRELDVSSIAIPTITGQDNNIYADTGDMQEVKFIQTLGNKYL